MEENTIETMEAEDSLDFDAEDWAEDTSSPEESTEESVTGGTEAAEESTEEAVGAPAAEEKPEEAPGETFGIKYNGEEMQLSREQMTTLAQKGMNYDKVLEERDRLRAAPEIELVARMARLNGMTPVQYMEALQQAETNQRVQAYIQKGVPEEEARQLVQLQAEKRKNDAEIRKRQSADAQKDRIRMQVEEFRKEYPDVNEFPPEVLGRIRQGEHPVSAYRAYQIAQMETEIKALREQKTAQAVTEKNRAKSVGSVAGAGAASDPMLDAFDSVFD